jgi:hypothetical protein
MDVLLDGEVVINDEDVDVASLGGGDEGCS